MVLLRVACCLGLLLAASACGGGSGSPAPSNPSPSPPGSGGATISGREPLGWSQAADSIAGYTFAIYVDGDKRDAPDASCTPATSGTFECRSSLPSMSNGVHTLEVSATIGGNGGNVEGPRSAPITVTVNAATTTVASLRIDAAGGPGGSSSESAARQPGADPSDGLRCGLAPWDDHRALLWTSNGDLSLTSAAGSRLTLTWRQADDDAWGLSSAARDEEFDATRFVFLTLIRRDAGHQWLRVARYRDVQGTLGERAILLEQPLDFAPSGTWTAMDMDGRLLVALLGPSADAPRPHQFITAISTPGGVGIAKPSPVEMDAPIAVDFSPKGGFAILDRREPQRSTLYSGGTTTLLNLPETPIALRSVTADHVTHLVVVGTDGALLAVEDGDVARPLADLRAPIPLHDAVLLPDGTSIGCGVADDATHVVSGRWRPVTKGQDRR